MDEVNSMCEQMGDISKEMGALRGKKWNYILTDLVGCLGPLITWICVRKDCKLEAISKEISESPKGWGPRFRKRTEYLRTQQL